MYILLYTWKETKPIHEELKRQQSKWIKSIVYVWRCVTFCYCRNEVPYPSSHVSWSYLFLLNSVHIFLATSWWRKSKIMRDLWVQAAGRVTLLVISHRAGHAGHTCHLCCMESKTVTTAFKTYFPYFFSSTTYLGVKFPWNNGIAY